MSITFDGCLCVQGDILITPFLAVAFPAQLSHCTGHIHAVAKSWEGIQVDWDPCMAKYISMKF